MNRTVPATTRLPRFAAMCAAIALAGCSKAVTVEPDFPTPLIEALPLTVGLQYTEQLTNYKYKEMLPDDATWTFELGDANVGLFDTVFTSLFDRTVRVQELADIASIGETVDAVIAPSVDEFEFSLPRQARSDQYSVWIRYNIDVYAPDGQLITRWPVSAYGQSDSRTFGGGESMAQATISAMRDAAATIAIRFAAHPKIKESLLKEPGDEEKPSDEER